MREARISVVVLTHDRPRELAQTVARLLQLPEQPPIIVVDNGSRPGAVAAVLRGLPVQCIRCEHNRGAAGRNAGVARVRTPYVAFCDDAAGPRSIGARLAHRVLGRGGDAPPPFPIARSRGETHRAGA